MQTGHQNALHLKTHAGVWLRLRHSGLQSVTLYKATLYKHSEWRISHTVPIIFEGVYVWVSQRLSTDFNNLSLRNPPPFPLYVTEISVHPGHGGIFARGILLRQAITDLEEAAGMCGQPQQMLPSPGSSRALRIQGAEMRWPRPSCHPDPFPSPAHRSAAATRVLPSAPSNRLPVPKSPSPCLCPLVVPAAVRRGWLEVAMGGLGRAGCRRLEDGPYFGLEFSDSYWKHIENAGIGNVHIFQPLSLYWKEVPY